MSFPRTTSSDVILLARLLGFDSTRLKHNLSSEPNLRSHALVPSRLLVRGCIASSGIRRLSVVLFGGKHSQDGVSQSDHNHSRCLQGYASQVDTRQERNRFRCDLRVLRSGTYL